jgi:hypothetical protein
MIRVLELLPCQRAAGVLVALFLALGAAAAIRADDVYSDDERSHWSLLPRRAPPLPGFDEPRAANWLANPIDAFVLARLQQAELQPASPADRRVLARRLHFSLTGLPPTPEEIAAFERDAAPDACERLIDRLLASPHYGEAWGQHWLDVVRYSESEGFEYDRHRPGAWRFRDYVIRGFNTDKPFDQFLTEQLAGDELQVASEADAELDARIAAGFHRLGPIRRNAGNSDVAFSRNEVLTEMTDAVGFVFLGLTVGCARCHDHMFDAVRQRDYYRLQAFLAATQEHDVQLGDPQTVQRWNAENDAVQAEITRLRELLDDAKAEDRERLASELKAVRKRAPAPMPTISSVANDAAKRTEIRLLERGQTENPRELVGPRFPGALVTSSAAEFPPDVAAPKKLLADWLADPSHPLTARVYVNRLWNYQFGQGIVATPNDFGVNGAPPSHPQLLDYLANELVASGWSAKRIHRLIVGSNAFRQSSSSPHESNASERDPGNSLLWHYGRRRLTAEELRDALLSMSGRLNAAFGGESIMPPVKQELVDLLYDPAQWKVTADARQHDRRSVYLVAKRNLRLPFMEVFDQPDLQISCARRQSSTHAPQSLELLNGEMSNDLAAAFAARLQDEAGHDPARQIEQAYWLAAGRPPSQREQALAQEFLREQPLTEFALAMFNLNSFLYVE